MKNKSENVTIFDDESMFPSIMKGGFLTMVLIFVKRILNGVTV